MADRRMPRTPWVITGLSAVAGVALVVTVATTEAGAAADEPRRAVSAVSAGGAATDGASAAADAVEPAVVPGPDADPTSYDLAALPLIDVWTVNPALPVDDAPFAPMTGDLARPLGAGAPIFAAPGTAPLGYLARDGLYGGGTVPVVTETEHWVKVLLAGRQGTPPSGNPAQAAGWLRKADVELSPVTAYVEVHLEARSIDIVTAAGVERVVSDFAWGKTSTPTPAGRTFVMLTRVVPEFAYTEGHPLVYLGVQSPTLAGFDGGEVAVTAFHYYFERSGPNSFGCIYLDGPSVDRLALLPEGTPVIIHP